MTRHSKSLGTGRFGTLCGRETSMTRLMRCLSRMSFSAYGKTKRSAGVSLCADKTGTYPLSFQRLRTTPGGKGEIADTDFMMPAITSCVKNYWRNIHKQWRQRMDPEKHKKLMDTTKFQSRRSTMSFPTVLCQAVMMLMR